MTDDVNDWPIADPDDFVLTGVDDDLCAVGWECHGDEEKVYLISFGGHVKSVSMNRQEAAKRALRAFGPGLSGHDDGPCRYAWNRQER